MKKWQGIVIIVPKDNPWQSLIESVGEFPEDFMIDWTLPTEQGVWSALDDLFY